MSTGRKMRNQLIDASQKGPQFQTDLLYKVNVVFNFGLLNALGEQHDSPNNWCSGVVHFVMCSVQTGSRCRLQFLHYHRPVIQRIALERCWSVFLTRIRSVHRIRVGSVGRTGGNRQPLSLLRKKMLMRNFLGKLPKRNFFYQMALFFSQPATILFRLPLLLAQLPLEHSSFLLHVLARWIVWFLWQQIHELKFQNPFNQGLKQLYWGYN